MYNCARISLVVPCYNEEQGLAALFRHMPDFIDEVLVIDNGSTDGSAAVARDHGARLIHNPVRGYGVTYQKGLPEAGGDIIVAMDADDSYPLEEIAGLLAFMQAGNYDFVSGCRFPLAHKEAMPRYKQLANYFISWLIRRSLRISLRDSQSGCFVFRREILGEIMPVNSGMGFSQELKLNAWLKRPGACAEFPLGYRPRVGRIKYRSLVDGLGNLLSLLHYLRGRSLKGHP